MPYNKLHTGFEVEKTTHSLAVQQSYLDSDTSHIEKTINERLDQGWVCTASAFSEKTQELILWWKRELKDKLLNEEKKQALANHFAKRAAVVLSSSETDVGETWFKTSFSNREKIISEWAREILSILEQYI